MSDTDFCCLPTIVGSLPHHDAGKACDLVNKYLKEIPCWPQLPKRSFLENMYVQYSQGMPGIDVDGENQRIFVNRSQNNDAAIEKLYTAYLENDITAFPLEPAYAKGMYRFLETPGMSSKTVKGQVTGPISFGLTIADNNKQAIIYDEVYADLAAKLLRLKASWQEQKLREISKNTIMFLDEPYMVSFGSAYFNFSREKVIELLEEVLGGIQGLSGVHCCGNTDWSVLLATSLDILNLDAYNYADSLALYPDDVKNFLQRGGAIAWGIVPNEEILSKESIASLQDRLEEGMAPFTRNGVPFRTLLERCLLTPSCGLGSLPDEEMAEEILKTLTELSKKMRGKYF